MAETVLQTFGTVQLDSSGNGRVQLGPPSGVMWNVSLVTVSTASQASPFPQCNIYAGAVPLPSDLIDGTYTGNGDSTDRSFVVYPGMYVWAVWTGGNPNDSATVRVAGTAVTNYR